MNKILIIDDDTELCELLREYMAADDFEITAVHSGRAGLEAAKTNKHDLVILDIMLPEMNGIEVLKELRAVSEIPVIMLTAKGDEVDRVLGLELGADDYLPKPFSPRELMARIKAVARRTASEQTSDKSASKIEVDDIVLETASRRVIQGGNREISLTEVEFSILENLMRGAGTVIERQTLAEKVLGRRLSYEDRSLDVHMSNLRKKLGLTFRDTERIKTIRGVGYLYAKVE